MMALQLQILLKPLLRQWKIAKKIPMTKKSVKTMTVIKITLAISSLRFDILIRVYIYKILSVGD